MNYTKNQDNKYSLSITNDITVSLLMAHAWWRPGHGETLHLSLQLCIQRRQTSTQKSTVPKGFMLWKWVSDSLQPHGLIYSPWNSPGQNTGAGSRSLLHGIFPTQWLNPDLLHHRQILYQQSYQGSLKDILLVSTDPLVVARRLICSTACGILLPWPEIKPMSPTLQGRFLTAGPPGKSRLKTQLTLHLGKARILQIMVFILEE